MRRKYGMLPVILVVCSITTLSLIFLSSALSILAGPASQAAQSKASVTVVRSHVHAYHLLAPLVAQEKGFFSGIDVKVLSKELKDDPTSGKELLAKMNQMGADVAADARTRVAFTQDSIQDGVVIIGGWTGGDNDTAKVVARKEIRSIQDLRGKRMGAGGTDSENSLSLSYMLHKAGVDPEREVKWVVNLSRNRAGAKALREGKVDAAFVSKEETPGMVKEGYHVLLDYEKLFPDGRPERVIMARRQLVEKDPETVKIFLKGMLRAYRLINDWRKNEALLKTAWDGIVAGGGDPSGESYQDSPMLADAMVPLKGLESQLAEEKELGRADKTLRVSDVVNLKALQEALAELKSANISY
ncbi:MAG: ABC transporter substrate-binding protein [Acidobacteria bacterium]|nr:ABC transporter substrate-binding protein [Acidobacteriota bacterium]